MAGFDNIPLTRLITPALTTMAIDIADLGERAINRLAAILDGGDVPLLELRRPSLMIRASTQPQAV